jgi:hypothetical protein
MIYTSVLTTRLSPSFCNQIEFELSLIKYLYLGHLFPGPFTILMRGPGAGEGIEPKDMPREFFLPVPLDEKLCDHSFWNHHYNLYISLIAECSRGSSSNGFDAPEYLKRSSGRDW